MSLQFSVELCLVLEGPPPYNSLFPSPNQLGRHFRRRMSHTSNRDVEQPRVVLTCCRLACNTGDMLLSHSVGCAISCLYRFCAVIVLVVASIIFLLPVCMIVIGMMTLVGNVSRITSWLLLGAQHLDDCPIQSYIPIFLIVMGIIQMVECCGRVIYHMSREEEDSDEGTKDVCVFFLIAWFIAGNVWVFGNYSRCDMMIMFQIVICN